MNFINPKRKHLIYNDINRIDSSKKPKTFYKHKTHLGLNKLAKALKFIAIF